jgi:CHAT domain-containing protein
MLPRRLARALLALGLALASPTMARAQPADRAALIAEAERLDKETDRLYQADKLDEALAIAQRALALTEKSLGPNDPHTAGARSNLGGIWLAKGNYLEAEPLLREAVARFDQIDGANEGDHANALNNLGVLYSSKGQPRVARPLLERAVSILEGARSPSPVLLGATCGELANILITLREPRPAMALLDRSIALLEAPGAERHLVLNLVRKADLMRRQAMPRAFDLYERAVTIADRSLGEDSLVAAEVRRRFARTYWAGGSAFDSGEKLYAGAAKTLEKVYGPMHPELADLLCEWAVSKQLQGNLEAALDLRKRADAIDEHHLRLLLAAGSEEDKRAYSARLFHRAEDAIELSLTLGHADTAARRFAFMMVLRRKGRVLDALTDQLSALRRHLAPEHQALLAELSATRTELANLVLRGSKRADADQRAHVAALEERERRAESAISAASAAYRSASQPPTIDDIARAIPEGAVLIEMLRFSPTAIHDLVDARLAPVYVAYALRHDGNVRELRLADARTIDSLAHQLRQALSSPDRRDVLDLGARLYRATLARFEDELDRSTSIILSPDGELNLVPFAALGDTQGNWLVRRYSFSYLSSGRDLLRLQDPSPPGQKPVILANPAYGDLSAGPPAAGSKSSRGLSLDDFSRARFPPLPGTQIEAEAIRALIPEATLLTGEQATKAALRALRSPSVLHIATHGFALGDSSAKPEKETRSLELEKPPTSPGEAPDSPAPRRDARFQSGIALAGANRRREGNDDGVLTALEAASLDLSGTKLVVLSACETGVGDLARGEGVYSLRRAFVEAGAETQVMSLWQVDDHATQTLMSGYYRRMFKEGKGRSAALREQQLAMLADTAHDHPYYWASFIVSGDPSPLTTPGGSVPGVAPSARGCGCALASPPSREPYALGLVLALCLARRRKSAASASPKSA